jgi:hypothetical protein
MTTVEDHLRAAVASLPNAVVSHEAAAELHGLRYVERGLATVMVHSQTTHEFPGVTVRRSHDLAPDHLMVRNGLPVTTAPRTIVDLASVVSRKNLAAILDDAVAAKLAAVRSVAQVAMVVGRSGKPGTRNLRTVLDERLESGLIGTPLENKGNALLLTIEEATPTFEYAIPWRPEHRFDAAYPAHQLAIEWDSIRWHLQESVFGSDRARDREAILHGWRVLRFTWFDVSERPDDVVLTVRRALEPVRA